ncbi:MAG: hypothetical protein WCS94_09750 [Verrucomicrobiota bacterium]
MSAIALPTMRAKDLACTLHCSESGALAADRMDGILTQPGLAWIGRQMGTFQQSIQG